MPRRPTAIEAPRSGNSQRRALCLAVGLVVWMLAIGVRLVQLQVHQHEDLSVRARNQQLSAIETSPTRGQVLDRQGRELARSIETASFFADPREIVNPDETARHIVAITGQDRAELLTIPRKNPYVEDRIPQIPRDVTRETACERPCHHQRDDRVCG